MNVIKNDRFPETRRFRQGNIARNHALKDLCSKKSCVIRGNLPRKRCPLVIHREQDTLDFKTWVNVRRMRIKRIPATPKRLPRAKYSHWIGTARRLQLPRIQCQQVQWQEGSPECELYFSWRVFQSSLEFIFAVFCNHQAPQQPRQGSLSAGTTSNLFTCDFWIIFSKGSPAIKV